MRRGRALLARLGARTWWTQRSLREQWLLGGLACVTAIYFAIAGVAQPLVAGRAAALEAIAEHDRALAQLEAVPTDELPVLTLSAAKPVTAVLTETASEFELAIRRIEPEDAGARLVLDDADFAEVLLWIEALESEHRLRLTAIEMDRRPEPGVVSARMSFER